jgi:endonuclease YncB( thermonuclease family)
MERATTVFWTLVATLLGLSVFFGTQVWRSQSAGQPKDAVLASGDVVRLQTVIDGDTINVVKLDPAEAAAASPASAASGGFTVGDAPGRVTVRLVGIKTFESKHGKDETAVHGRAAEDAIRHIAGAQPLRVLLNSPPKDRTGRTLAQLFVGDEDLGHALVSRGHALVYTVYPFAGMPSYLQAQRAARMQRLGLWADPAMVEHADALLRAWARTAP